MTCDCFEPRTFGHVCHIQRAMMEKFRREMEAADEISRLMAEHKIELATWVRSEHPIREEW